MKNCEKCGKKHDGSYGSGRFCCRKCANSYSRKSDKGGTKVVKCVDCGKEIEVNKRTDPKKAKCVKCNPKERKRTKKPDNYCNNCGKIIKRKDQICCSVKCSNEYRKKKIFEKIEKSNGIGCEIRRIKEYLISRNGHKCSICNNTKWMEKPIPLVIDHINGRANDNRLENLRLVCNNCDAQLPTYKSKNKNSDRKRRVGRAG